MRKRKQGIFIPATAVRVTVVTVAAAVFLLVLSEAPELRRYLKLRSM